jgi:hypothetical protein
MFEHKKQPLLSPRAFARRQSLFGLVALLLVVGSLFVGIGGYHFFEGMNWLDSLLNASMILGGMGPVNALSTVAGKIFASFYALFAGVVFLIAVGVLIAPSLHRFLHKFHLQEVE